ncbi:MAG: hypothetical protein ACYSUN_02220 [Planctomycetota bacterium]|jgi:hypothetical protein
MSGDGDVDEAALVDEMLEFAGIDKEDNSGEEFVRVAGNLTDLPDKEVKKEDPPAEEAEDKPAETSSEEAEGDDDAEEEELEEEPAEESDDEPNPLLEKARELGLGYFKTEEDLWKTVKHLRSKLSQRDDDAAYGRELREKGYTPDRINALAQGTEEKPEETVEEDAGVFKPPHPHNPAWDTMIRPKLDEDGNAIPGQFTGPPDEVRKYIENEAAETAFWQEVRRDPSRLVSPKVLDRLVEEKIAARESEREKTRIQEQSRADADAFLEKHGDFIEANPVFWDLVEKDRMTPERAVEYLKLKANSGKEPEGKPAKKIDELRAAKRRKRRAGAAPGPAAKPEVAAADKTPDEILASAMESMSDEELAELALDN